MSADVHAFLLEIGRALSLAGTAVDETHDRLLRIAAAYGIVQARVAVLPTVLMIATGPAQRTTIEPIPQTTGALRLDQISVLYDLVRDAERGAVEPADGLARLTALRAMRPRFGYAVTVLAHTLLTAGLCLILQPTPLDLVIATGFGAVVGLLAPLARSPHRASTLAPILCATVVSAVTFTIARHGIADPGLRTLIAPLTTFLPGSVLTTATVELAAGEMVAGTSRLVYGGLRLLLLAFGIVAGAELAGVPRGVALTDVPQDTLGWWAPWAGVLVFAVAVSVYFSAPRGTLRWLLVVVLAAWIGQLAGDRLVGDDVSGFFGALVMTPVALAVARLPGGPPSQVTFLPAFWLLVPGAVGLIGVTEVVGNPALGLQELMQPLAAIVAIALGVLSGASLDRMMSTVARHPSRMRRRGR